MISLRLRLHPRRHEGREVAARVSFERKVLGHQAHGVDARSSQRPGTRGWAPPGSAKRLPKSVATASISDGVDMRRLLVMGFTFGSVSGFGGSGGAGRGAATDEHGARPAA